MARALVIHWTTKRLAASTVRDAGGKLEVENSTSLESEGSPAELGRQLANSIASFGSRSKTVIAVGRDLLSWQHLTLPPCPEEELPDLVRLQADYASNGSEDLRGLDFLPLSGGTDQPHKVWCVSLPPNKLAELNKILAAAEITADHICPAALGWPELAGLRTSRPEATISLAPFGGEPAAWASVGEQLVLFRQLQLPEAISEQFPAALSTQVRRTLLTFAQENPTVESPALQLVGGDDSQSIHLAADLSQNLGQDVHTLASPQSDTAETAILGLGEAVISGHSPLVDLANPRKRPEQQSNYRTYYLAAAAAIAVVALGFWEGYQSLQEPLKRAANMEAEIALLTENKESYTAAEAEAAAIRAWLDQSVNLLSELQAVTGHVRTEPLDSESFPVDDDIVVGKVVLQNRQFIIDAYAMENSDLQPVEYRLRDGKHRVRRGETSQSDEVADYPVKFQAIVDVSTDSESEGASP